jgi:DNA (cytosine-5)-methyltransferase 1
VRVLIRANKPWEPRLRSRTTPGETREEKQRWVRQSGMLRVRWRYVETLNKMAPSNVRKREPLALTEVNCSEGEYV